MADSGQNFPKTIPGEYKYSVTQDYYFVYYSFMLRWFSFSVYCVKNFGSTTKFIHVNVFLCWMHLRFMIYIRFFEFLLEKNFLVLWMLRYDTFLKLIFN